jgi:hypothetical protein
VSLMRSGTRTPPLLLPPPPPPPRPGLTGNGLLPVDVDTTSLDLDGDGVGNDDDDAEIIDFATPPLSPPPPSLPLALAPAPAPGDSNALTPEPVSPADDSDLTLRAAHVGACAAADLTVFTPAAATDSGVFVFVAVFVFVVVVVVVAAFVALLAACAARASFAFTAAFAAPLDERRSIAAADRRFPRPVVVPRAAVAAVVCVGAVFVLLLLLDVVFVVFSGAADRTCEKLRPAAAAEPQTIGFTACVADLTMRLPPDDDGVCGTSCDSTAAIDDAMTTRDDTGA